MFRRTKVNAGVLAALGAMSVSSVLAQNQQPQTLERVEITGSAVKRIDAETAVPIQILTREDVQRTGATTVEQLLQTVSANSSSGGLTASSASGATTGGISAISLRGLGSARTLVLVNGRRVAPYGVGFTNDSVSVDVNSIPIAAIERVEVLKDGASSLYGSDAIAGVVNFILRKDVQGLELSAEAGAPTRGGGANVQRASIMWGKGDLAADKYNIVLIGSIQKESALFGRDRDFARHSYNVDEGNDTTSGNTFPANIAALDGSFGSRNPTAATGCVAPYSFIDPNFPANRCRFDPASLVTLLPKTDRIGFVASGKFALTNEIEGFVEASINRNKQRTVIQPVPISDQFTIPANNPLANTAPYNDTTITPKPSSTIILHPSSPYYPTTYVQTLTGGATPDLLIRYRAGVNGNRDLTDISTSPRLTFGARGTLAGWDFDSAFLYSSSRVREQVNDGYPIYSKILPLLNSGNVNFFGANTPDVDAQLRATNFTGDAFKVASTLTSVGGKVSRDIGNAGGGAVAFAVGAELRHEQYGFTPSTELAQGDLSGYGGNIAQVDKGRQVGSLFSEIAVPLTKTIELDGGARFDKYQGVGNSFTPKVSLRWQPMKEFLIRGSVGNGFRAPSLADLYTPTTTGVSQTGLSDPLRCPTTQDGVRDCATQFATTNGGNSQLKPEKSTNFTLGLVLEPTRDVSVAVDAFRIRLKDTISQGLPQAFILANIAKYGSFITRGPVDPAFPTLPGPITAIDQTNINLGQTKLSGIDLDARVRVPAGDLGRFLVSFSGTYFLKYDTENPDGTFSPQVGNLNNATTGGVIPRWKTYQAVTWSRDAWDVTAALNWQSSYLDVPGSLQDPSDPAFQFRRVGAYETVDLQASYSGFKGLRFTLGVKNLFDRNPPYTNQGFSFQSGYDPQYADPRGRFLYAKMTYAFK